MAPSSLTLLIADEIIAGVIVRLGTVMRLASFVCAADMRTPENDGTDSLDDEDRADSRDDDRRSWEAGSRDDEERMIGERQKKENTHT